MVVLLVLPDTDSGNVVQKIAYGHNKLHMIAYTTAWCAVIYFVPLAAVYPVYPAK
jgi:hypothetical protein